MLEPESIDQFSYHNIIEPEERSATEGNWNEKPTGLAGLEALGLFPGNVIHNGRLAFAGIRRQVENSRRSAGLPGQRVNKRRYRIGLFDIRFGWVIVELIQQ